MFGVDLKLEEKLQGMHDNAKCLHLCYCMPILYICWGNNGWKCRGRAREGEPGTRGWYLAGVVTYNADSVLWSNITTSDVKTPFTFLVYQRNFAKLGKLSCSRIQSCGFESTWNFPFSIFQNVFRSIKVNLYFNLYIFNSFFSWCTEITFYSSSNWSLNYSSIFFSFNKSTFSSKKSFIFTEKAKGKVNRHNYHNSRPVREALLLIERLMRKKNFKSSTVCNR